MDLRDATKTHLFHDGSNLIYNKYLYKIHDIISVFKVNDPDVLPVFVARDLEKLPPITLDHLDVSKLLKDLMIIQTEIKNIKSSYATVEQLETLKRDCLNEKPTDISPPAVFSCESQ